MLQSGKICSSYECTAFVFNTETFVFNMESRTVSVQPVRLLCAIIMTTFASKVMSRLYLRK